MATHPRRSASTGARDRGIKRERYTLFGVPDYWVVDVDARRIERYRPAAGSRPEIFTETMVWQPIDSGPVLTFSVPDVFRSLNDEGGRSTADGTNSV